MTLETPDIDKIKNELKFTTSRSSGPGGQSVNKLNTKVSLRWDVNNSTTLNSDQRSRIMIKLDKVINNEYKVVLSSQENKSQLQNKETVIRKLEGLIIDAFIVRKSRKPTKPTKASVKRRLKSKKKLSEKKKLRGGVD